MPLIEAGYGQATVNFVGENLPNGAAIVVGFGNGGLYTAVQAAQHIWEGFQPFVDDMLSSDGQMVSVDVKLGPNDTGPIGSYGITPVIGGAGSTSLSPGTAVLIEKQSALGGRRGRGRMYVPCVYDGWVDDAGRYVVGVQAQIQAFADALLAQLVVEEVPMYLLHSPSYTWEIQGGQPRRVYGSLESAGEATPVTALAVDPVIATQRRRLR